MEILYIDSRDLASGAWYFKAVHLPCAYTLHSLGRSELTMAQKRIKHTDQDWFDLITECRRSQRNVKVWCEQHGITVKAFYYHTQLLRQKGYPIPPKTATSPLQEKQEVVCLDVPKVLCPAKSRKPPSITEEGRAAICLSFHGIHLEVTNYAGRELLSNLFQVLLESC